MIGRTNASVAQAGGWLPPSDWQDITSTVNNQVKLLVADTNLTYAFRVVTSAGTWSVNWGDGTSDTGITSGNTIQHTYTRGTGVSCSRGYTTFIISITSDTGNIQAFYVKRHSLLTVRQQHDILYANISTLQYLTTAENMFYNPNLYCPQLESVIMPTSWGSIASASNMFRSCYSLQQLTLPTSWGSVTNVSYMFYGCYSLQYNAGMEYLGSTINQADFTNAFISNQNIDGALSFGSLMSKFTFAGTSGNVNHITSIRLTNAGSLFEGTSPHVDVAYNNMDATALNNLFGDLPTLTGKTIRITGCTGVATCNTTIATSKGWTVNSTT